MLLQSKENLEDRKFKQEPPFKVLSLPGICGTFA